jgi:uncharacterized repeat protein (TIGR03987 family)
MLPIAIFSMLSALALYTVGVWGEKLSGLLQKLHVFFFWGGFVFDTLGTTLMGRIAGNFTFNFHGLTGLLAIVLMLSHALWASLVLLTRQDGVRRVFHRFSLAVWLIWLVPFFTGVVLAMG